MQTNPLVKLKKLSDTNPVFAALVPANGKGETIPFILNPTSLGQSFGATITESQIYKGNSPSNWVGYKADRIQVGGLTLSAGGHHDVSSLIKLLKDTVTKDVVFNYVHGNRIIESVRVVSGNAVESMWLGGIPTEAEATLELMKVYSVPTVKVSVKNKITANEVKKAIDATIKLGYTEKDISVNEVKGTVSYQGKVIANWVGGKLVLVSNATKAPLKPATEPTKQPGNAPVVNPSPIPPKFTGGDG